MIILGEATALGLFGGVVGVITGWLITRVVDAVFASQVSDFPFKPETLFIIEGWMVAMGIGAALVFCWLGAIVPAIRASHVDPASALTSR